MKPKLYKLELAQKKMPQWQVTIKQCRKGPSTNRGYTSKVQNHSKYRLYFMFAGAVNQGKQLFPSPIKYFHPRKNQLISGFLPGMLGHKIS